MDGFFLDDAWSATQRVGSNACDGSPIGGPSEVDSFCITDMGLVAADTAAITAAWSATTAAATAVVNAAGGMRWSQFEQVNTPARNATAACAAFFRAACGPSGAYQAVPLQLLFSEAPGRVFDPLPSFAQDLATFLLVRGPHAWIGYTWNGCSFNSHPAGGRNNQSWSFPDALDADVGEPVGFCAEASPNVFARAWTRVNVSFDCNAWEGRVEGDGGVLVAGG